MIKDRGGKIYPLLVSEADAKNPPRKRKASRAVVLGAKAFPTWVKVQRANGNRKIGRRP